MSSDPDGPDVDSVRDELERRDREADADPDQPETGETPETTPTEDDHSPE